jgi:uncharacterized GH25 family protein
MNNLLKWAAFGAIACVPLTASAHKTFLLPSATVLSASDDAWITVDAAVSNDLFYFNHVPMRLDALAITAPDGSSVAAENANTGKFRSTFDAHLTQQGTYRIAIVRDGLSARYKDANGETKRARGSAEEIAKRIPADATDVAYTQSQSRLETFVTLGNPDTAALAPSGAGLELVPVTHPNDLYAGEKATFRLQLDGKPAAGLEVSVIPGGTRYRNSQDEIKATTGADGSFSVTWPAAGTYWLNASSEGDTPTMEPATARRVSYTATFEVLPQ